LLQPLPIWVAQVLHTSGILMGLPLMAKQVHNLISAICKLQKQADITLPLTMAVLQQLASNEFNVTVSDAPTITTQPAAQTEICAGNSVTLSVAASNGHNLSVVEK